MMRVNLRPDEEEEEEERAESKLRARISTRLLPPHADTARGLWRMHLHSQPRQNTDHALPMVSQAARGESHSNAHIRQA